MQRRVFMAVLSILTLCLLLVNTRAQEPMPKNIEDDGMSPMGHLASVRARARTFLNAKGLAGNVQALTGELECDDDGCETPEDEIGPGNTQSELAIAIDPSGNHVVLGFNDFRGANLNPLSVSGYAYSDDGGVTWVDGGQLPVTSNGQLSSGTRLPQVFGDPDIKNVGGCNFIYSSILVKGFSGAAPNFTGTAQTMSIHRSTDCGHTWTGPFEVTPATNPHSVLSGANARDAADKEFLDVDPETGRVLMSWSNFSSAALTGISGGVEIRAAFSDNIMSATPPTWSAGVVLNTGSTTFDTGSMPRFARSGSNNAYVAWATTGLGSLGSNIRVATSLNNGLTWGAPVTLNPTDFFPIDQIVGNDRVHSFPGMAVGPDGNVYVVYANNSNHDGSDIALHRSTNGGASFSAATFLNSRPGSDRSQWYPYVTADPGTGRVYVVYYDQVAASGDLTTARYLFSDDGGVSWSTPSSLMSAGCVGIGTDPLDCRPFHAGYGNDTSQPNLGDYIGATTFSGNLYAVWAATSRQVSFVDGQPNASFTTPDFYVNKVNTSKAALAFAPMAFTDSGGNGFVDAGDQVMLKLPLSNFLTNPADGPVTYTGVTGTLSTSTPGVTIVVPTVTYPDIAPGVSQTNVLDYVYNVSPGFVPGTRIELSLSVSTTQGSTTLLFTQNTGTPVPTTIFSENFNGISPGFLPAGWATIHVGGTPTVPWTTNNTFCGTASNALFHVNANDGTTTPVRFERVASPNITVPSNAQYVTLDFDICYDTEDDPNFNVLAYDGADLRITDFTTGHFARAVFVEAFAEQILTGASLHYPRHNPRSSNTAYFQDISMWAGDSQGFKHVRMRLPGMEGTTIQLRPDFTQDGSFTCTNVRPTHTTCGVMIDNIVMRSVVTKSDELLKVTLTPVPGSPGVFTGTVMSQAIAGAGGISVTLAGSVSPGGITILPASLTIPAGSQTSPSFTATLSAAGAVGTVTATGPSNSRIVQITATGAAAAAGQYSDGVTLTATVNPSSISGQTATGNVTFLIDGSSVGSSPINASGIAVLPYTITLGQGSHSIVANFHSSNSFFGDSTGSNTLTVSREDAVISASPSNPSTVQVSTPGGAANFSLGATVKETPDGSPGDISNAVPVSFTLVPIGPGSPVTVTAATTGGGVGGTLTAVANFSAVPVNVYEVATQVGGNFYAGSSGGLIAVYDPSLRFVTGGGTITRQGVTANFGLNFKYLKNGNAQGQLVYIEHRPSGEVKLKSNAIDSVSIVGNEAIILGKATLNDAGNHRFRAIVVDKGEPGTQDQFGLEVTLANGTIVPDFTFAPVTLAGGNIQVPQP